MDATMNNQMNGQMNMGYQGQPMMYGYGQPMYGAQQMYGYQNQPVQYATMGYGYQPTMANDIKMPTNMNFLTDEEIKELKNNRPSNIVDLNIPPVEYYKALCNHKDNGVDLVKSVADGSGDVYCPLCGERWSQATPSKEEVQQVVNTVCDLAQIVKWVGNYPTAMGREYFAWIPLFKKFPEMYEYALQNFNKYFGYQNVTNANEASIFSQYNTLMNGGFYPMYNNGYYGQQQQAQQMPQQGYYGQQMTGAPVINNPYVNPMQAVPYGVNPMAPNQQFVQQAQAITPQAPVDPAQQTFAAPQAYQPAAPAQAEPAKESTETKVTL